MPVSNGGNLKIIGLIGYERAMMQADFFKIRFFLLCKIQYETAVKVFAKL
jgi:hypothetical protein